LANILALPQMARADEAHRLLQFNMAGSALNAGGNPVADDTANSINSQDSTIVTLNEVCYSQFSRIRSLTGLFGFFVETNGPNSGLPSFSNRCSDSRFGNAALSTSSLCCGQQLVLPYPSSTEVRKVGCGLAGSFFRPVELCVTHIRPPGAEAEINAQISEATDYVNSWVLNDRATVFGGDFNKTPPSSYLNRLYAPHFVNGSGLFGEIDQHCGPGGALGRCGDYTFQSNPAVGKIDYIWLSSDGTWCCLVGTVSDSLRSDHRVLRGTARLR
jgi:endonuclease/exonuclease/phosphatase family metal-dependent hydrolase